MPFAPPQCTECGACCAHTDPKWVELTNDDAARIPAELLQAGDIQPYAMKMCGGHCVALRGVVGRSVSCLVYPNRPTICRQVQRGDAMCAYMHGYHRLPLPFDYDRNHPEQLSEPR